MQLLSVFNAPKDVAPIRVPDVKSLKLPSELEKDIVQTVHEERMLHELWMESAENFTALKASLAKRGYKNLPMQQAPQHMPMPARPKELGTVPDTKELRPKKNMLRRGSYQERRT